MSRVKRGTASSKRRNYLLKRAKGFKGKSSTIYRIAKERLLKAEDNAYISRKLRKRDFRKLWIQRINGALDFVGSELNYSRFIGLLNKSDVKLNRKMISELAIADIENFKVILSKIEGGSHTKSAVKSKDESTTKAKPSAESTLVEKTSNIEAKTTKKDEVIEAIEESLGQEVQTLVKEAVVEKTSNHEETKSSKNDDLKVVEGIGPAIEKLLHASGINTYKELSNSDFDTLKAILVEGGSNFAIHNPTTWARQALLAADGKFDELEKLKDELINGKEVA